MSVIRIRGGRLIDPVNGLDQIADLYLADGKVLAIGGMPIGVSIHDTIDATGKIVAPAFTDLCARLREPGPKQNGTIASETRAAAVGGFSQVVMPPDTQPVMDSGALAALVHERAANACGVRVFPVGAITKGLEGKALANMAGLKNAGCIGVGNARAPFASPATLLRCLEYAATLGLTVYFSPEDESLAGGCAHEGFMAARLGLPGIPYTAETVALATQLILVEQTGVRAHFGQLSCSGSVELIRIAKEKGLPVTADVSMHQLHLTDAAIDGFNAMAHVRPPLRSADDRDALREGVRSGVIDAICSDHQPLDESAKLAPFPGTEPGMSTLETVLPLGLQLVKDGVLSLAQLVDRLAVAPRRVLGQALPSFSPDAQADVVVFDPEQSWEISATNLLSRGKNSAFLGLTLQGRVSALVVGGKRL